MTLTHIDLFSGIGGFALAAQWAGIQTVQFVEIDKFCQKVLQKNFPGVPIHEDIRTFTNAEPKGLQGSKKKQREWNSNQWCKMGKGFRTGNKISYRPFLITGGFPCQPFSCAGKRKGDRDDRFLWPEMLRVIKGFQPTWVIGENVAGIASMVLTDNGIEMGDNDAETQTGDRTNVLVRCITDLESIGYDVQTFCIPACSLGAPHRRDRVWIVGNRTEQGLEGSAGESVQRRSTGFARPNRHAPDSGSANVFRGCGRGYSHKDRIQTGEQAGGESRSESARCDEIPEWHEPWLEVATRLCRVDDGVSDRVHRLKALGNAIVPQIAFQIIQAIVEVENKGTHHNMGMGDIGDNAADYIG